MVSATLPREEHAAPGGSFAAAFAAAVPHGDDGGELAGVSDASLPPCGAPCAPLRSAPVAVAARQARATGSGSSRVALVSGILGVVLLGLPLGLVIELIRSGCGPPF
jgi:hypothetical protein